MIYVNNVNSCIPQVLVPISTAPIESKSVGSNQSALPKKQSKSKNTSKTTGNVTTLGLTKLKNATTPNLNTVENKEYTTQFLLSEKSNILPQKEALLSKKSQQLKVSASQPQISNLQNIYEKYWDTDEVNKGLIHKVLIQGKLRINQRSYEDAFITDPNGGGDIYINGLKDRNRALNGDIVAIKLKEKYLWNIKPDYKNELIQVLNLYESESGNQANQKNVHLNQLLKSNLSQENKAEKRVLIDLAPFNFSKADLLERLEENWFQKTAFVVSILEKKNSRWAAGHLKLFPDKNNEWALFSPNDSRIPRIKIRLSQCPPDFYTNSSFYASTLFIAQILDIPINSRYAVGELKRCIGVDGDIEVETEAFLIENGIDYSEFDQQVLNSLPKVPWSIPESEFTYRRDLRHLCIFTIDPATARDLDDALHCIKLNDDLYEVGVHIADVSYFVDENSPIDKCALERTTSVYLVQKVIPMLPRLLCEQLCSLNPALDRLTFSVIWKIKANGDIVDEWFGRTIINSAVKLSYEHAQKFIESPNEKLDPKEFPEISSSFNLEDIKKSVLNLDFLAKFLRARRFENGCLTLNQTKISFVLNKECGLPYGYSAYQQKDSNKLVEEFMLLANIAVAHRIYKVFPSKSILRRHPSPNQQQIEVVGELIRSYGFDCDIKSSNSIQIFLESIKQEHPIAAVALTCQLTKTMQLAQYFCSGFNSNKDKFYHYGLAVPLYTHFTSPIRRYPDILVHRLLAASLNYCEETTRIPALLNMIAENCNDKKSSARICSERSSEMFFALFVNECGPLEEEACVTQILDHSFDVLICRLGFVKRIYSDKLDILQESFKFYKEGYKQEISFTWKANDQYKEQVNQTVKLFSPVNVKISKHESEPLKMNITLMHPSEKISNAINEIPNKDKCFDQRVDTDPYICD